MEVEEINQKIEEINDQMKDGPAIKRKLFKMRTEIERLEVTEAQFIGNDKNDDGIFFSCFSIFCSIFFLWKHLFLFTP